MSVLWFAAGEEIEFNYLGSGVTSKTGGNRRVSFVRASLGINNLSFGNLEAESPALASPVTDVWFSFQHYPGSLGASYPSPFIGMGKYTGGVSIDGIYVGLASAGKLAIIKTVAGVITQLAAESATSWLYSILTRWDVHVTGFGSVTGTITVYQNQNTIPLLTYSGDLSWGTNLDVLRSIAAFSVGGGASLSEIIVADEDTRAFVGVASLAPSAAGTTNTFTSGAYTDVDEVVIDDTDMLISAATAQEFDCNVNDAPAGNYAIRGVKVNARAMKGASGPTNLQIGINSGGTRDVATQALSASLANYERLMILNPITGVPFTLAEVNALQIALKSLT